MGISIQGARYSDIQLLYDEWQRITRRATSKLPERAREMIKFNKTRLKFPALRHGEMASNKGAVVNNLFCDSRYDMIIVYKFTIALSIYIFYALY